MATIITSIGMVEMQLYCNYPVGSKAIWRYSHFGSYRTVTLVCAAANLSPSGRMPLQVQQSTVYNAAMCSHQVADAGTQLPMDDRTERISAEVPRFLPKLCPQCYTQFVPI